MAIIKDDVVELNAYEAAAYWWVKRIKNMTKQIKESPIKLDPKRYEFLEIFDYDKLKNEGYRKIYLYLAEKFEERCEGHNRFSIRTHAMGNGHAELITWLSEITGQEVPSLNIGELGAEDISVVFIKEKGFPASSFTGSPAHGSYQTRLPNMFKPNPVLCGIKKKENEEDQKDKE